MKRIVVTAIIIVLTAAAFFCLGMHHAIMSMEISADENPGTVLVTLHDQIYIHGIDDPLD